MMKTKISKNKKLMKYIMDNSSDIKLGKHISAAWARDPKHLGFVLARYKFVSKCLTVSESVLEVGAGDGFGSWVIKQNVKRLELSDIEKINLEIYDKSFHKTEYFIHDFIKSKFKKIRWYLFARCN